MSDSSVLILLLLVSIISSGMLGYLLAKSRPGWSSKRIVLLSALPVPGPLAALLAFAFIHSLITSQIAPDRCGVDVCSMVMAVSMMGFAAVGLAFGAAALFAFFAVRRVRR